jgi:NAD-dependent deacetylase
MLMHPEIASLRRALEQSDSIVALTGAGISAESGVPTFRGSGGLWRDFRPDQLATAQAFVRDSRLVWEWYDWRRGIIHKAQPNTGHLALAALERRKDDGFTLITQNVDGLHDRAGSRRIIKLHGDIWEVRCTGCSGVERNEDVPLASLPPQCSSCGAMLRPNVVWFGEALPLAAWDVAMEASRKAEIFLLIGTSAVVYPAASLVELAHARGARVAVINPEPTPVDELAQWTLRGPAGEILPQIAG